ncbi:MAG: AMP-binding protein [Isosphaeraceae bacterium]|nr:AMP-binding protein [Isosphaeraceae bacterium]
MTSMMPGDRVDARGHFLDELRMMFAAQADRPALVYQGRSYAFADLDRWAQRCAAWLQGLGVQKGDRVVLATAEKLPFLVAHLGILYAGGISLPLNPRFTRDEMGYFLGDSGARVAIVGQEQRPVVEGLRAELPELAAVVDDGLVWELPAGRAPAPAIAADDPCLILYSSGTTGRPKGVVHTHANLAASLHALRDCWRFTPEDITVNVLPLFHIHGLSFATHLSLLSGGCMVLEDAFHPRRTLEVVGRGTVFMAIPTFYYAFRERPEFPEIAQSQSWQHVRLFTCGSAPIRPEVLPELEAILGRPVINRYGMTEGHVITSLPLDGPWPQGSVGLPLDGIELRIAREDGTPAASGEVGTVLLRGPNLFRQYWRNPEATRAAFASGWFDTGDLGSLDHAGFLTLVGRKNDLIITHGLNVYPQVVERVINACPGVRESAVVGLPDDRRGERVAAAIVRDDPALDERQLRAYWSERLVDYQRPTTIVFLDALPRNTLGKVLRRELRDQIARSL